MIHISYSPEFLKQLKHLAKKYKSIAGDLEVLRDELKQNPYSGADLGGGARKVRLSIKSKGKGKSGGARVITYLLSVIEENVDITLLTIYDKSERESIRDNEIKALIQALEKE